MLWTRGIKVHLKVAGAGEIDKFKALAERLRVGSAVEFLGLVKNDSVQQIMRDAAVVVVPSQHAYPEGFPLTIYEALCARTPLVASDHPMFARRLIDRVNALIYPSGQPVQLAGRIEELLADQHLYASLSSAAQEAWEGLQVPVKWGDLLYRWICRREEDIRWLREHRLTSGRYDSQTGLAPTSAI
jgi:glycosyltransferase involved in cell wall biosynthesis